MLKETTIRYILQLFKCNIGHNKIKRLLFNNRLSLYSLTVATGPMAAIVCEVALSEHECDTPVLDSLTG